MQKRVTLKDISKKLNVSVTTVTKALNGKPQVSDGVRKLIFETANELGYKPNKTAQALVRNEIVIGIVYPKEPHEFIHYLEEGMEKGINDLIDYKVRGIFKPVKDLNSTEETKETLKELYDKKVNGIIISTGYGYKDYLETVNFIKQNGIPIIYLLNEINEAKGIGCVKLNGVVAGKMAAQFLSLILDKNKKSAVILTSNKEASIHRDCINGFIDEAERNLLNVRGIYETQDDKKIAYYLTEKILKEIPDLGGIYVSSYNSVAVCNCLEDNNMSSDILVIGQDLYPELAEKIEHGSLKATLFQDPFEQGRTTVKKMYNHLTEQKNIGDILTIPQLVMRSNLECYKNKY